MDSFARIVVFMKTARLYFAIFLIYMLISGWRTKMNPPDVVSSFPHKTYAWTDIPKPVIRRSCKLPPSRVRQVDIQPELDKELKLRGLTVDTIHPGFLISYKAVLEVENYTQSNGFIGQIPGYMGQPKGPTDFIAIINRLSLQVVFYDPGNRQVLWNGSRKSLIGGEIISLTDILEKEVGMIIQRSPVAGYIPEREEQEE